MCIYPCCVSIYLMILSITPILDEKASERTAFDTHAQNVRKALAMHETTISYTASNNGMAFTSSSTVAKSALQLCQFPSLARGLRRSTSNHQKESSSQ